MQELMNKFFLQFGESDNIGVVKSPLRICLLGAHIYHQYGLVTGMTLDASIDMV